MTRKVAQLKVDDTRDVQIPHDGAQLRPFWICRAYNLMRRNWTAELKPFGLSIASWQILSLLAMENGVRVGKIAKMIGSEQALVSRTIDQMEAEGWIERRTSIEDQRANDVWITRKGQILFDKVNPLVDDLDIFGERITQRESDKLVSTLAKMVPLE